jgi:GNAT superfamily N-acetyltransferase
MNATSRRYDRSRDYGEVGEFLVRTYRVAGDHINWLQPRWEYMHHHPDIGRVDLSAAGIWELDGEIVAVVHMELYGGTAYFEVDPAHARLKREMLAYAEEHLSAPANGRRELSLYINDRDHAFQTIVDEAGYEMLSNSESMSYLDIGNPALPISLPGGFKLRSSSRPDDTRKMHRLLHRGFNHGVEPEADGLAARRLMESAPNYESSLNVVVHAPGGDIASYCGIWYESTNKIAYVEPMATDPDYRGMGLARAALLEAIQRCAARGGRAAYVGSSLPVYLSVGFRRAFNCSAWRRRWT